MNKSKLIKIVFVILYIVTAGFLSSYWFVNNGWGNLGIRFPGIVMFVVLLALNVHFAVWYYRENQKGVFVTFFITMIFLCIVSILVRTCWIELRYTIPIRRSIDRVIYDIEKYLEYSIDFDLKGTIREEPLGKVLVNGPSLDEEGKHYFELKVLTEEIEVRENEKYGPYSLGGGMFNPSNDSYKEYIKYCIIEGRINDHFIKYSWENILKSKNTDYRFFVVIDSSKSIKDVKDRIEFVMTTGDIPKLSSDKKTLEGEIIVFKNR